MANPRQWNEGGHAIVDAAFAIDFTSLPPQQTVRELLSLHSKIKVDYPRKRENKVGAIALSTDEATQELRSASVKPPQLGGFTFDSLKPDGRIERSITFNENKLLITRGDYTRWEEVWPQVRDIFKLMVPYILQRADILAFHLQYRDRFAWEGDPTDFKAEQVFRRDCKFLVPNVFDAPDLWHSYHGYFEYPDHPHRHQLLNVAEVQLITFERVDLEAGKGLVADISLNHRVLHGVERGGGPPDFIKSSGELFGEGDGTGLIDDYMNEMHNKDKELLAHLITNEMCDIIQLERP